MELSDARFEPDDDDKFVWFVTDHLKKGAATLRGITDVDYVQLARSRWNGCASDKVYAIKFLVDPLVDPELVAELPDDFRHSGQPFCTLIARIGSHGELVDAPEGYTPPSYPGVHLAHIVAGSPSGGDVPDPREPAEYLIAFLDVLGFEALLNRIGLDALAQRYQELLAAALDPQSESRPWSRAQTIVRGETTPALMCLPIQTAYFSDSLLLWVPYLPGHVEEFLYRCSRVFCEALSQGLPVRGAISAGRATLDKERGIYLGLPLIEAVRLENKANWVGVSLAASWKSETLRIPVPPDMVFIYDPPLKEGSDALFSGLVLDWPRVWRESREDSALPHLADLRLPDLPQELKARYDAASTFWLHSEANQDLYLPPGFTRETVRGVWKGR
ncbi:MAG: hypothetical protein AUK24_01000 [Syntrophaceae bacterium CG2_30_49_12]|nr:MAG: hypothetical protein AUK24_01000 [Syntrophaceae bacterium CG2_30_49_12]